jgi:hypothetical protein
VEGGSGELVDDNYSPFTKQDEFSILNFPCCGTSLVKFLTLNGVQVLAAEN